METCYEGMRSFFHCWLSNKDQVWLCCKRKLWSGNNSTCLWLYLNQQSALVKEIFRNLELFKFCHLERYESGLNKFNICVHWFLCRWNGFAHMFVHAKICVHKKINVGANLHCLIYNVVNDFILPICFDSTQRV